jgi:GT2 family glycosyltransferase
MFARAAEDNDFCYRWLTAGRELRFEPDLLVWHHDWRTPRQLNRRFAEYAYGQGAFYAKHLRGGDRAMARFLASDLKQGARSLAFALRHRRPRWTDEQCAVWPAMVFGFVAGWRESGRRDHGALSR